MSRITRAVTAVAFTVGLGTMAYTGAEAGWKHCATEPQPCKSTQPWAQVVRFGTSNKKGYRQKTLTGNAIGCDRASFGGDPAPFKRKKCWIWVYDWKRCASELNLCKFPKGISRTQVRFGTTPHKKGMFRQKTVKGSIRCDRPSFGGDPVPNKSKSCWYWDTPH